jgi:L-lactate dehydrogenase complex protein LldG
MVTAGLVRRFAAAAAEAGAEVIETRDQGEAADAVAAILGRAGIDAVVAGPDGPDLGNRIRVVRPRTAKEFAKARAGIVQADYGAAETGTLVRLDTDDEEKLAWTLPPLCVCFLDTARIVPGLDSLSSLFTRHLSRADRPGPQVSLVTGPSRTADIECQLTIGVQGPERLLVVLFGGADS